MQQYSSRGNGGRRTGAAGAGEMDGLLAELRRVLERIAQIGPPETVTVPLTLPRDLAELMSHQALVMGRDITDIHVWCLLHGQYHAALEAGASASAQHIAGLIRRAVPPPEWERFCAQHPEAREGL